MWEVWKKAFYAWESTTAEYAEEVLRSPAVLKPSGTMLTLAMKMRAANQKAVATWLGAMGMPTKRDQERMLHTVNQLQSQLYDLEEKLEELSERE